MDKTIGIINYGAGNLFSVMRGFAAIGANVEIVTDANQISSCDSLVLPGVGAFGESMVKLHATNLIPAIKDAINAGKPLLGICLGAQLLHTRSLEFGVHTGLDLIPGEVRPIPDDIGCAVPHVGWASLHAKNAFTKTPLQYIQQEDQFYFTHSYVCYPQHEPDILATFFYESLELVAVIAKDNIFGCQFHPELSSYAGQKILRQFCQL